MKSLLLIPAIFLGFHSIGFSQSQSTNNEKLKMPQYTFEGLKPLDFPNSIGKMSPMGDTVKLKGFNLPNPELGKFQLAEIPTQVSKMPVFVPKGNYPMLIHEPDSTVNYTLQIKKYQK
jgi:hypothetical protein